jgi:hypothetical protein
MARATGRFPLDESACLQKIADCRCPGVRPEAHSRFDSLAHNFYLRRMVLLRERVARRGIGAIEPCLPSPAKQPPAGPGWMHEIKHDGFRLMARRDARGVRLIVGRATT